VGACSAAQLGPAAGTQHMCEYAHHAAVVEDVAKQQVLAFNEGNLQRAERWWVPSLGQHATDAAWCTLCCCCHGHAGA
jgi:hypothetical protein